MILFTSLRNVWNHHFWKRNVEAKQKKCNWNIQSGKYGNMLKCTGILYLLCNYVFCSYSIVWLIANYLNLCKSNDASFHFWWFFYYRDIVKELYAIPQDVLATRLVHPLLSRFVLLDTTACSRLLPHLLTPYKGAAFICIYFKICVCVLCVYVRLFFIALLIMIIYIPYTICVKVTLKQWTNIRWHKHIYANIYLHIYI